MRRDLTKGNITQSMLLFSLPLIAGNLLQQFYNVVDTFIVGRYVGANALAAVGSSFTLMVFLTSIILGLCMGSGAVVSQYYGAGNMSKMKTAVFNAFILIGILTAVIFVVSWIFLTPFMNLLNIQEEVWADTKSYLGIILWGIGFTFIYNFFSAILRSVGESLAPLIFLAIGTVGNIVLDILFVVGFDLGVAGAAQATVIAQGFSALGIGIYFFKSGKAACPNRNHMHLSAPIMKRIAGNSILSSIQQSIMNFGILLVQGLVNSFGVAAMAAFAAAAKIDSFAYMPAQDFGNGFSTFVAQNYGANKKKRLVKGLKSAVVVTVSFCTFVSLGIFCFADKLMQIFIAPEETEIIAIGVEYLQIEGVFYCLIGCLFLLYGFYRGIAKPQMSIVLTIISLGTRVVLAYMLAPIAGIGLKGIWWAVPIGWLLADLTGFLYLYLKKQDIL